jgi:guanine deaminase
MKTSHDNKNVMLIVVGACILLAIVAFKIKDKYMNKEKNHKKEYSYNDAFMKRAIDLSAEASLIKKTGGVFGAVVVKDGEIIGEGYNQVISQNDCTWHAEIQALREAGKKLGTPHLTGCVLYTSAECCPMCLCAAYWGHIEHIYYAASVEDALKYGEFKDVDFYKQICEKPADRLIGMTQKMQPEAVEVWKAFSVMPDRARY